MDEHFYVITFASEYGVTKQIRISDANPSLALADMETPLDDMMRTSIFDHEKVGDLTKVKSLRLEKVKHTLFDMIAD